MIPTQFPAFATEVLSNRSLSIEPYSHRSQESGVNHVPYLAAAQPVATAVALVVGVVEGIWGWDVLAPAWQLWSPALQDLLQGFTQFEPGLAYFVCLVGRGAVGAGRRADRRGGGRCAGVRAHTHVRREAAGVRGRRDDAPAPEDRGGWRGPGGAVRRRRRRRGGVEVAEPSHLYFIDEAPGARYGHAPRFVLVEAASGNVVESQEQCWPVLDGEPLLVEADDYWNPAWRVFARCG